VLVAPHCDRVRELMCMCMRVGVGVYGVSHRLSGKRLPSRSASLRRWW
jgi:hypothetical protein